MDLTAAVKKLLIKDPFYGLFLISLDREYNNTMCDTACVYIKGINPALAVNKQYWDSLSDDHQLGVLKHEINS